MVETLDNGSVRFYYPETHKFKKMAAEPAAQSHSRVSPLREGLTSADVRRSPRSQTGRHRVYESKETKANER